jgi:hypothetical protein
MSKKEINRREFIRAAGAAGVSIAAGGLNAFASKDTKIEQSHVGLAAPKLERVRTAFIGVGARGSGHVAQMLMMDGVDLVAICDTYEPAARSSAKRCTDKGRPEPKLYLNGSEDFKRMFDEVQIDAVLIATPWSDHVRMSVEAMRRGIHAFVEVPAATTIDDGWQLVEVCEKTKRHCMMMENVCYGREELLVLNMCRLGVFGELLHGEAAYIHDLRGQMHEVERGTGSWRTYEYAKRNGNLYPTHGLGPVAQYMNVNRGDRFDFLSSVSSPSRVREIYAEENFPADHKWNRLNFICGDINTSIIKTVNGKTIMVQWDEQLPRPYTRHNLIQGTRGVWGGFPDRLVIQGRTKTTEEWAEGDSLNTWYEQYEHPLWKRVGEEAVKAGGHGGMDFVMLWRIVHCLRNGLPLDQDVYDAAAWSAVTPLSIESNANRARSVDFPDFTRGKWKHMPPLQIVS